MNPTLSPDQIMTALSQYIGSDVIYRHDLSGCLFTEGVKGLAEMCGAWWLIDAIASWQPRCRRDPLLREMQFWTLKRQHDGRVLVCDRDKGDEAYRQVITFSDFPLEEIRIWVVGKTMLLPSEY